MMMFTWLRLEAHATVIHTTELQQDKRPYHDLDINNLILKQDKNASELQVNIE